MRNVYKLLAEKYMTVVDTDQNDLEEVNKNYPIAKAIEEARKKKPAKKAEKKPFAKNPFVKALGDRWKGLTKESPAALAKPTTKPHTPTSI